MRFAPMTSVKFLVLALVLSGCAAASLGELRLDTARRLASAAWMVERDIPAGNFNLRGYERMHERHASANVYIEGDGVAGGVVGDPTPRNPVALHLATKDKAENVVYLARPCHYIGLKEKDTTCTPEYWREKRYSAEVIDAYDAALNEISKRYDIKGFNLIGYDGGGAIAMLLGARRGDIVSIRTVAGVLDHEAQSAISGRMPLSGSLNPVTEASTLSRIPQYHFIGGQDESVPPSILQSYMQASPPSTCVNSMLVQEAGHDEGWVNKWPELLALPVTCYAPRSSGFDAYYDVDGGAPVSVAAAVGRASPVPPVYRTVRETPEKP